MSVVTTRAIVLQAFPYGDSSRILRLLTRDAGIRSVIARGATRPRSQYSGVLEPFTEGNASIHMRDNRDLLTLSGFELTRSRQSLGQDLMRFGGASLIAEILLRTASEEAQPELFDQVADGLDQLCTVSAEVVESHVLAQTWSLIATLGFAPSLDECVSCARTIATDEETRFSYSAGGVLCNDCRDAGGGSAVPPHARADLTRMLTAEAVPLAQTAGHWSLLQRYLDHHVLEGNALRSLTFLAAARSH